MENKTDEELFQELYNSTDCPDIKEFDIQTHIEYCENLYNMNTDKFLEWYEESENEGNVDLQLWYKYAKGIPNELTDDEIKGFDNVIQTSFKPLVETCGDEILMMLEKDEEMKARINTEVEYIFKNRKNKTK